MSTRDGRLASTPDAATRHTPTIGTFVCFGQAWRIGCDDDELATLLADLYRSLRGTPEPGVPVVEYQLVTRTPDRTLQVLRDGVILESPRRPARALAKLMWAINRQVIDAGGDRVVLHAAAAADPAGHVVLLPAPMESGKTTLVAGLLDRGLSYLTDEAVSIGADLTVYGYAKPLSIDEGSWEVLHHHEPHLPESLRLYMIDQWQVAPRGFSEVTPSGRSAVVVFPQYVAGAETELEPLSAMRALDLARASAFGTEGAPHPVETVRRLAHLVSEVPCFALRHGDLTEACDAVLRVLGEATGER